MSSADRELLALVRAAAATYGVLTMSVMKRAARLSLRAYVQPAILCIDEVGYLSYDSRNADLLYQALSLRYEKKSLVLTTNLAFSSWPSIFPSATSATALIDRVVHHADVIKIEGDSYRLREAERQKHGENRRDRHQREHEP